MSRSYYYFAASLPLLDFDAKLFISYEEFMESCQYQLSEEDFAFIKKASLDGVASTGKNVLLNEWLKFNNGLRNEIAWFRANEMNKDPYDYMRGDRHIEPVIVDVIAEATRSDNPLDGEEALDRAKWRKLEELVQGHYFDLEFLIVYALKLQILERYQEIHSSKGQEIFEEYQGLANTKIREILVGTQ